MRILAVALAGSGALVLAVALGAVMGGIAGGEPAGRTEVAWWAAAAGAAILLVGLAVEIARRRGLRR